MVCGEHEQELAMRSAFILAICCLLTCPAMAGAGTASAKIAMSHGARKIPPAPDTIRPTLVLRQDLFDRNNPNNLRSDYSAPPAQPGQF